MRSPGSNCGSLGGLRYNEFGSFCPNRQNYLVGFPDGGVLGHLLTVDKQTVGFVIRRSRGRG